MDGFPITKTRKSLYSCENIPTKHMECLFLAPYMTYNVTEKTDGVSFAIGADSLGFYACSASTGPIRETGGFSFEHRDKLSIDPMVTMRLDFAFELLSSNAKLVSFLEKYKLPIFGELIIKINGKIHAPNNTDYTIAKGKVAGCPSPFKRYGAFIIHTQDKRNRFLNHLAYNVIFEDKSEIQSDLIGIGHDQFITPIVGYVEASKHLPDECLHDRELFREKLLNHICSQNDFYHISSLTVSETFEDYVVHMNDFSFKMGVRDGRNNFVYSTTGKLLPSKKGN